MYYDIYGIYMCIYMYAYMCVYIYLISKFRRKAFAKVEATTATQEEVEEEEGQDAESEEDDREG